MTAFVRRRQVLLVALMGVLTLNIWTGSPLLAVWIGSRVQGTGPPSMTAVFVVAATMVAFSRVLLKALAAVEESYARLTGQSGRVRQHVPWLRSMRGERPHEFDRRHHLGPLEIVLVASVMLATVAFEVWFFFFSGSPIGSG
jgi:hypothetical protein